MYVSELSCKVTNNENILVLTPKVIFTLKYQSHGIAVCSFTTGAHIVLNV